ncbi:hypothetical protein JCM10908_002450 [Rhodotorula pacifica]|uniref:uncharacterized protein n=1 Tax=Rhodotorula pacifica TaxID=1495444 RepID=UPI003170ED51
MDGPPPPIPDKESKSSSLLPSLRLQSLDELLVGAVLKAGPTGTSVQGNKEALSLQTTSVNFRRFVQKSGPIFVAQDAVESVVRWEDPAKTSFFAAAWAILCYWPSLVVLLPNVILVSILLTTYQAKKKHTHGPPPESQDGPTPLAKDPPSEGSIDYFANLQNIQIMMGRIADLTDVLRSFVPYLTWRDERLTRLLFLLSILSSFLLALSARYIPWRLVLFLLGESTLLFFHPLVRTFLADAKPRVWNYKTRKACWMVLNRLLEDDELREDELDCEVVEVQRIEVESRISGGGSGHTGGATAASTGPSGHGPGTSSNSLSTSPSLSSLSDSPNLDAASAGTTLWQTEAVVGGDLPLGFRWLSTSWEDVPPPLDGAIDVEGWTYIFLDGYRAASPSKVLLGAAAGEKDRIVWAQTRRRRLVRRAIKNPLL